MKPAADHLHRAASHTRNLPMGAAAGGEPEPDATFHRTLSKALEELAAGLELVSARE
jgi:hypothetical protein